MNWLIWKFSSLAFNFSLLLLRAQLFEGRLALNPGLNLTRVSFSFVQNHFLGQFSVIFIEHRISNLLTKRIKQNLLYKLLYLNWNFALTLGYLNPALNNSALGCQIRVFLTLEFTEDVEMQAKRRFSAQLGSLEWNQKQPWMPSDVQMPYDPDLYQFFQSPWFWHVYIT